MEFRTKQLVLRNLPPDKTSTHSLYFDVKGDCSAALEQHQVTCSCARVDHNLIGRNFRSGVHKLDITVDTSGKKFVAFGILVVFDGIEHVIQAKGVVISDPKLSPSRVVVSREWGSDLESGFFSIVRTVPVGYATMTATQELNAEGIAIRLVNDTLDDRTNSYGQRYVRQTLTYAWRECEFHDNASKATVRLPWSDSSKVQYIEVPFAFHVPPPFSGLSDAYYLGTLGPGEMFSKRIVVRVGDNRPPLPVEVSGVKLNVELDEEDQDFSVLTFTGVAPNEKGEFMIEGGVRLDGSVNAFPVRFLGTVSE